MTRRDSPGDRGNPDQSSKKYVAERLQYQGKKNAEPPLVDDNPIHPGGECPCADCKGSR